MSFDFPDSNETGVSWATSPAEFSPIIFRNYGCFFGIHLDNGTIANTDHQNYLSTTGEKTGEQTGEQTGVPSLPHHHKLTYTKAPACHQRSNAVMLLQRHNTPTLQKCSNSPALQHSNTPKMLQLASHVCAYLMYADLALPGICRNFPHPDMAREDNPRQSSPRITSEARGIHEARMRSHPREESAIYRGQ